MVQLPLSVFHLYIVSQIPIKHQTITPQQEFPMEGAIAEAGVLVSKPQETGRSLGRGSYGEVVEVRVSGRLCAAKKLHGIFNAHDVPPEDKDAMVECFKKECNRVLELKHANIVEIIGVHYDQATKLPTLVMELMDTSLCSYLNKNPASSVTLTTKYSILLDVASGLVYLHTLPPPLGPIVHRDLTANNVLLASQGGVMVAKIADLGQAKNDPLYVSRRKTLSKVPGNEAHMPPEAWFDIPQYNSSLDIFSFGVVMLHTLSHEWPEPLGRLVSATELRLEVDRRKPHLDKIGNSVLKPLIVKCLSQEPKDRPATSEVYHVLSLSTGKHNVAGLEIWCSSQPGQHHVSQPQPEQRHLAYDGQPRPQHSAPPSGLEVDSVVQIANNDSRTGVIRWIGEFPGMQGLIAGVELVSTNQYRCVNELHIIPYRMNQWKGVLMGSGEGTVASHVSMDEASSVLLPVLDLTHKFNMELKELAIVRIIQHSVWPPV